MTSRINKLDRKIVKFFECINEKYFFPPHLLLDVLVDKLTIPDLVIHNYYSTSWKLADEINKQLSDIWRHDRDLYWRFAELYQRLGQLK
jgi:hypothetical protein